MSWKPISLICLAWLGMPCLASAQETGTDIDPCAYNPTVMLRMTPEMFDNKLSEGWRKIADIEGCETAAADLLAFYRTEKIDRERRGLMHHEMQLRAATGETDTAIALLTELVETEPDAATLAYRKAELAFLEQDLGALRAAREELAAVPKPEGFETGIERYKKNYPDRKIPTWPLNLDTVDGLINCFEKPYAEAYSYDCRLPAE